MDDRDYWEIIDSEDLWVIDKLILAKTLGYKCGPASVPPHQAGEYIVRPCVNFKMMSAGAYVTYLSPDSYDIPDGYFWCERFTGRHLSFDYNYGKQILAVEGFRNDPNKLNRFSKWQKIDEIFFAPKKILDIAAKYEWFNIEVIGDKIIEVHFRYNDDFKNHNSDIIIPIWKEEFYDSPCGDRVGFLIEPNTKE